MVQPYIWALSWCLDRYRDSPFIYCIGRARLSHYQTGAHGVTVKFLCVTWFWDPHVTSHYIKNLSLKMLSKWLLSQLFCKVRNFKYIGPLFMLCRDTWHIVLHCKQIPKVVLPFFCHFLWPIFVQISAHFNCQQGVVNKTKLTCMNFVKIAKPQSIVAILIKLFLWAPFGKYTTSFNWLC